MGKWEMAKEEKEENLKVDNRQKTDVREYGALWNHKQHQTRALAHWGSKCQRIQVLKCIF